MPEAALDVDVDDADAEELQVTDVKAAVARKLPASKVSAAVDLDSAEAKAAESQCVEDADDEVLVEEAPTTAGVGRKRKGAAEAGRLRRASAKARSAAAAKRGAAVTLVDSGSESSSSGSSSSQRRNKCVGAAAATALLSAQAPLDIDEADRLIDHQMTLPTRFAARLQHEGDLVAIMAELEVNISIQPAGSGLQDSTVSISGTAHAVGRAVSTIELQFKHFSEAEKRAQEEKDRQNLAQVKIPSQLLSATVGPNGAELPKVRKKHGDVMIALMPPEEPGGALTAYIGPGTRQQVDAAKSELEERLARAEKGEETKPEEKEKEKQEKLADAFDELMQDVEGKA